MTTGPIKAITFDVRTGDITGTFGIASRNDVHMMFRLDDDGGWNVQYAEDTDGNPVALPSCFTPSDAVIHALNMAEHDRTVG